MPLRSARAAQECACRSGVRVPLGSALVLAGGSGLAALALALGLLSRETRALERLDARPSARGRPYA